MNGFDNAVKCPKCKSCELKFQMRQAGIQSKTNYYHLHSGTDWLIPSWHKTYRSKKRYVSLAQCQHCGYVFEPKHKNDALCWLLNIVFLPIVLFGLFFTSNWFKENRKPVLITAGTVFALLLSVSFLSYLM